MVYLNLCIYEIQIKIRAKFIDESSSVGLGARQAVNHSIPLFAHSDNKLEKYSHFRNSFPCNSPRILQAENFELI